MDKVTEAVEKWRVDEDSSDSKATLSSLNYRWVSGRIPDNQHTLPCLVCGIFCVIKAKVSAVTNEKNTALLAGFNNKIRRWSYLLDSICGGKLRKVAATLQLMGYYYY